MRTSVKDTIEKRRALQEEEQQRRYKEFGIFQPLKPANYREVVMIVPPEGLVALDNPAWLRIQELAKKDRLFNQSIREDPALHEVLTYAVKRSRTWKPKTPTEDIMLETVYEAVEDRLEYVMAQKVLLGKYFHLLSDEDKVQFEKLARTELYQSEKWLRSAHPNYKDLHHKFLAIASRNFFSEDHDPKNPAAPYNFGFPLC